MARVNNLTNFLTDVASAIKEKKGSSTNIPASNFDTEILALPSQGTYQTKSVTVSANGSQTITPDAGYDAIDELVITTQVPEKQLQSKSYTFTQNATLELEPETGYDGFSKVGLNINVQGEEPEPTTATVDDVISPKTFYSNGQKLTGNIVPMYGQTESVATYKTTTTVSGTYPASCMSRDYHLLLVTEGDNICSYILNSNNEYEKTQYSATAAQCGHTYSNIRGIKISPVEFEENKLLVVTSSFSTTSTYGKLEVAMFLVNKLTGEIYTDKHLVHSGIANNAGCIGIAMSNRRADLFVMDTSDGRYTYTINSAFTTYTRTSFGSHVGNWCFQDCYFTQNDKLLVTTSRQGTRDGSCNVITTVDTASYTAQNNYQYATSSQIAVSYDNQYLVSNRDLYKITLSGYTMSTTKLMTDFCTRMVRGSSTVGSGYIYAMFDLSGDFLAISAVNNGTYIYKFNKTTNTLSLVTYNAHAGTISVDNAIGKMYGLNYMGPLIFRRNTIVDYIFVEATSVLLGFTRNNIDYYNTAYDSDGVAGELLNNRVMYGSSGKITGTMPNNGALNYTPTTSSQSIPAGYTSGGTISAVTSAIDSNIRAENIKRGVTILGVEGTYDGPDDPGEI